MLSDLEKRMDPESLERLKAILKVQTVAIKAIHDYFEEKNFLQLMPVILSKYTDPISTGSEPGLNPGKIVYQNQELKLTQSMILNKQVAIGSGIDKLYIFSPNVRLEDPDKFYTGQHLIEFTQVDFEVADAEMVDIFKLVEGLLRRSYIDIKNKASEELSFLRRKISPWKENFPVFTSHELMERYGENWIKESSKDQNTPFFVTCFNRYFYDKLDEEQQGTHYKNYNLVYPEGYGVGLSGGEREYDFERIMDRMKSLGLSRYDYHEYLLRSQAGLIVPSAGAGLGLERMIRYFTGVEHIGDIQLFRRIPGELINL